MNIVHLQDDPYASDAEFENATVVVTKYEEGSYEGSGDALIFRNNLVEYYNLSHCSCYGPFEDGPDQSYSLEAFKEQNQLATCPWADDLAAKFLELVA